MDHNVVFLLLQIHAIVLKFISAKLKATTKPHN